MSHVQDKNNKPVPSPALNVDNNNNNNNNNDNNDNNNNNSSSSGRRRNELKRVGDYVYNPVAGKLGMCVCVCVCLCVYMYMYVCMYV